MNSSSDAGSTGLRVINGYRSLFYLLTPWETSYSDIKDVPDFVGQASPYFFSLILLEFIILRLKGQKQKLPRFNDAFSSLAAGVVSQLPALVMRNIELTAYQWLYNNYRVYELPWDSPWTWILTMFGVDLGYYWVHRCAHEINFMWAGHQTHHNSEDYNLSTALRQGVFQKYSSWVFYLPMALFIPPSVFLIHLQFNLLYQFWIHTQVIDKLGPLEYIMNTASHHRVHHGRNRYCIDKNYAGVFIIWDRMFGTFEPEQKMDEIAYGVVHPINSWNPVYTQTCHWLHILKSAWNAEGILHKMSILVKGPGWGPGKSRLGDINDIPDVSAPVQKYDQKVSRPLSIYCFAQFLLVIVFYESVMKRRRVMPYSTLWIAIFFIVWSLTTIGFTFESRRFAKLFELARWAVFLVLHSYWLCADGSNDATCPVAFTVLQYAGVASVVLTAVWLLRDLVVGTRSHKD